MSAWFMLVVFSGAVFTHKEVTSTGEIVIHNHPYDFTDKENKHHHSDDEIHFLDVVFCGVYTPTAFVAYEPVVQTTFNYDYQVDYFSISIEVEHSIHYLRGPPFTC